MQLQNLKLLHFRNYEHLEIDFHPQLNILYGNNGVGKTNLVEAIYVLALTRSFRNVQDRILLQNGASLSKIEGNISSSMTAYPVNYRFYLSKEGKKVKIDKNKVTKLSNYITKIPIVLFHPDDLKIIKDTPSTRRRQMNISISQYSFLYLKNLSIYNKILKQRNNYLKKIMINANQSYDYLNILTEKLANYGLKIYQEREEFINKINLYLESIYEQITGKANLHLVYKSDYEKLNLKSILKMYQKMLKKDLAFGKTNFGIHTDDFKFLLENEEIKDYGSEGQQKNAIIAYKFCELELLKEKKKEYPIFILDDLFSELDTLKIKNIFQLLKKEVQTFITTTDIHLFSSFPIDCYKSFLIDEGTVVKESIYERE